MHEKTGIVWWLFLQKGIIWWCGAKDESISLVLGKLVVTPVDVATRTVGTTCAIKTSVQGPQYNAKIAGRGTVILSVYVYLVLSRSVMYVMAYIQSDWKHGHVIKYRAVLMNV